MNGKSSQTFQELETELAFPEATVFKRLCTVGKMQKEGNGLTESSIHNRFNIAISLLVKQTKKSFLWSIVNEELKCIYHLNIK